LAAVHARVGTSCLDCHARTSIAAEVRTAATYLATGAPTTIERRRFGDAMCNRCHVDLAHQATKTDFLVRNPHRSHWPELRCGHCHVAHGPQVDFCAGCHDNGGQRLLGAVAAPRASNPWASPTRTAPTVFTLPMF
jgi:hypothetical protein